MMSCMPLFSESEKCMELFYQELVSNSSYTVMSLTCSIGEYQQNLMDSTRLRTFTNTEAAFCDIISSVMCHIAEFYR